MFGYVNKVDMRKLDRILQCWWSGTQNFVLLWVVYQLGSRLSIKTPKDNYI